MTVDTEGTLFDEDLSATLRSLRQYAHSDDAGGALPDRLLPALKTGEAQRANVARSLCELATDPDPSVSRRGQQILFSMVAEALGDSFDARSVVAHDSVFSHVIEFCRRLPGASHLDSRLTRFGIASRADLLRRKASFTPARSLSKEQIARFRKVFVLSRITLGADVAITSIVLQAVQRVFPNADRCLVGPPGAAQVLAGLCGSRIVDQSYDRRGLLERLGSWHEMTELLDREIAGLDDSDCLIIDPDSRLTQLGLLPVARSSVPYLFFESRSYRVGGLETLGELTAHWLHRVLQWREYETIRPRVALSPLDTTRAAAMVHALRRSGGTLVVAANLGVGGNARKRIPGDFELNLIGGLLEEGCRVVIDHGAGEDEPRVRAIVEALRNEGRRVRYVDGTDFEGWPVPTQCDLLAYHGPVGPFAALIAACDLYVGYDSAFQHIAAAESVPVVDIFVDPPNALFPGRWRPYSTASVIAIETSSDTGGQRTTLHQILAACRQIRDEAAAR